MSPLHSALSAALALAVVAGVNACTTCTTTYGTDKGDASDDAGKCNAIKKYLDCLQPKTLTAAGSCKLSATDAAAIQTDFAAITGTPCAPDASCICLKDFFKTDITSDANACTAAGTLVECLTGNSDSKVCGGTLASADIKTNAQAFRGSIAGCVVVCTVNGECSNSGTCNADNTCECTGGYKGDKCADTCAVASDCKNGATCVSKNCTCAAGFKGDFCQESGAAAVTVVVLPMIMFVLGVLGFI